MLEDNAVEIRQTQNGWLVGCKDTGQMWSFAAINEAMECAKKLLETGNRS